MAAPAESRLSAAAATKRFMEVPFFSGGVGRCLQARPGPRKRHRVPFRRLDALSRKKVHTLALVAGQG